MCVKTSYLLIVSWALFNLLLLVTQVIKSLGHRKRAALDPLLKLHQLLKLLLIWYEGIVGARDAVLLPLCCSVLKKTTFTDLRI